MFPLTLPGSVVIGAIELALHRRGDAEAARLCDVLPEEEVEQTTIDVAGVSGETDHDPLALLDRLAHAFQAVCAPHPLTKCTRVPAGPAAQRESGGSFRRVSAPRRAASYSLATLMAFGPFGPSSSS